MIHMNELEIIKELTELIETEFPAYLLITEEEKPDVGHLPPLRYVGTRQTLPTTISGPHLLIELETATPAIKDRIIRQTVYQITLQLQGITQETMYFYMVALKTLLDNGKYQIDLVEFMKGTMVLTVKR